MKTILNKNGKPTDKRCTIPGCEQSDYYAKGWCQMHYQRWFKYGDPLKTLINPHGQGCLVRRKRKRGRPDHAKKLIYVYCQFRGKKVQIGEHTHLAEQQIIHRQIRKGEIVHHIDLNPLNNDLTNLQVMTNADHLALHRLLEKQGIEPPDPFALKIV